MFEVSRQEMIDRKMCRPGYTWDETLQRCIAAYAGGSSAPENPDTSPAPTPDEAVKKESKKRTKEKITNSQPTVSE